MIHKKVKKEIKEVESVETLTECDICKKRVEGSYRPNWAEKKGEYYDREYSEINYEEGQQYSGEDGCMTKYETHVCVECFKSKVRPALEALGCQFHETDL